MDRAVRWMQELSPAARDALLAGFVACAAVALTPTIPVHTGRRAFDALALVLALGAALALVWRRRAPRCVLGVTLALMAVYEARGYEGGPALLAPIISVYTLAVIDTRARSLGYALLVAFVLGGARVLFTSQPAGSVLIDAVGFSAAALFLGWAVANRRAYVDEIRERTREAGEHEARRRVDAERLRIARELHDAVAHSISTINVQAGVAAHLIDRRPGQAAEALAVIRDTSKRALAEMREILGLLRQGDEAQPGAPTVGLEQLDALLVTCRTNGLQVTVEATGRDRPLPAAVDIAAYRIVQEALTNVLRHADAHIVRVRVEHGPTVLRLAISDDGRADGAGSTGGAGHGIVGMRERAHALGGTLRAGPSPDGGFEVIASLPLTTSSTGGPS